MKACIPQIPPDLRLVAECSAALIWRGQFIEEFAAAEMLVSETLALLAAKPGRGDKMKLPHLVGERFAALKAEVGPGSAFEQEGGNVLAALEDWVPMHRLRAFLCHGSSTVMVDADGRWRILLHLLIFRANAAHRETFEMGQSEAEASLNALKMLRCRLEGNVYGMLASLRPI